MLIAGASVSSKMNARRTNNPPLFETLLKDSVWRASRRERRCWKRDPTSEKETIDIRASPRLDALQTSESLRVSAYAKSERNRNVYSYRLGPVGLRSTEISNWLGMSSLSIGRMFLPLLCGCCCLALSKSNTGTPLI